MRKPRLLLLLLICVTVECSKVKLTHVYSEESPFYNGSLTGFHKLRKLIEMDEARKSVWAESPMRSGAFLGLGQYLVSISFGTPAQNMLLVADTGSDLIWVQCGTVPVCPRKHCRGSFYNSGRSSTLSSVPCSSPQCFGHCIAPTAPCGYSYGYADGSSTSGFLVRDTITISNSTGVRFSPSSVQEGPSSVPNVVFGCGTRNQGSSFVGTGGVLGLGQGQLSFVRQSGPVFSHTFSYCLFDFQMQDRQRSSSFLFMGKREPYPSNYLFGYTPLVTNLRAPTFYYVNLVSLRVSNRLLPIPQSEWAIDILGNGGTVVDSGSTLTYFRLGAYLHLVDTFIRGVHLERIPSSGSLFQGLEVCYKATDSDVFPRLTVDFAGGLSLELPSDNYIVEVADGVKCLAVRPTLSPFGFNVLGNILQQGYHVEFDRGNGRVGFARTECRDV